MNKKNFIKILQQPENLTKKELVFLEEISQEFPYFQPSRAIYLKSLSENKDIRFKKYLKTTAAYTRDRKVLFDFIKKSQKQNEKVFFNKNIISKVMAEENTLIHENASQKNSFVDWLKLSNLKPIDRLNESDIVDNFISKKPRLKAEVNQ